MNFNWFKIFNANSFLATGLVSRQYDLVLAGIGAKSFLATYGNVLGVTVDDKFFAFGIYGTNFLQLTSTAGTNAIYMDANNDVWWGVAV